MPIKICNMIICHAIVLSVLFFCTVVSLDTLSLSRSHSGAYTLYVMSNALNQVLLTFSAIYIYIAICCVFFFLFSAHNDFMYRFGNFDASVQLKTVSVCFWHIPVAIVSLFFHLWHSKIATLYVAPVAFVFYDPKQQLWIE